MSQKGANAYVATALALVAWTLPLGWGVGFAAAPDAGHLRIIWDTAAGQELPKAKKPSARQLRDWKSACNRLGTSLRRGRGPWGYGAFTSFDCERDKVLVSGTQKDPAWVLTVVLGRDRVSLSLGFYRQPDGQLVDAGTVAFPASPLTFHFFADAEFVDLVALAIVDKLPMGIRLKPALVDKSTATIQLRAPRRGKSRHYKYSWPDAADELTVYSLTWQADAGLWHSTVQGKATRTRGDAETETEEAPLTYKLDTQALAALKTPGPLWAYDSRGPGARTSEFAEALEDAQKDLTQAASNGLLRSFFRGKASALQKALTDTTRAGLIAVRYGLDVIPGDALLHKTSILGLLLEFRGGLLAGLRYYYDTLRRATSTVPTDSGQLAQTNIQWSRHVLGFSKAFKLPFAFDRLTVDPKLGIWTFNANLPVTAADGSTGVEDFSLSRTLSVALELGLEKDTGPFMVRGWYGVDTGFSLVKQGGQVTSQRLGLDGYVNTGLPLSVFGAPVKVMLLAFYTFEQVHLHRGQQAAGDAAGGLTITDVPYATGYAGGGVGLSW